MTIEIVSFPIKNGGSFYSYVSLPEASPNHPRRPFEIFQANLPTSSRQFSVQIFQLPLKIIRKYLVVDGAWIF
jgi:hypothetical protein